MKPTIVEALPLIRAYRETDGNAVGGAFHIVLDEGNVDDASVRHCIELARSTGDTRGVELGELLLAMSKTQRLKLASKFYSA